VCLESLQLSKPGPCGVQLTLEPQQLGTLLVEIRLDAPDLSLKTGDTRPSWATLPDAALTAPASPEILFCPALICCWS